MTISPIQKVALLFFLLGIFFWGGFNWSMEATNNEAFCISCHEMKQNVYQEYKTSTHYKNRTGVRATCPDCHVPKQWAPKVARKIQATNELYHWLRGSIDNAEKFKAKRTELAKHVWEAMEKSDSRECRSCHNKEYFAFNKQSKMSKKIHTLAQEWRNTCIDCHKGIVHTLPDNFDKEAQIDEWHQKMEQQNVACFECHENLKKPEIEEW